MDKKLDWNSAYLNDADTRAVLDSEIFRNYAITEIAKEKFVLPLHVPSATLIDKRYVDSAMEEAMSFPPGSRERMAFLGYYKKLKERLERQEEIDSPAKVACAPNPIMPNLQYDGKDYQEHVEEEHEKEASEETDLIKQALDEILSGTPIEEPPTETPAEAPKAAPKASTPKPASSSETNYDKLYNTGAGSKSSVNIGVTKETERLMDAGIDYVDGGKATQSAAKTAPKASNPVKEEAAPTNNEPAPVEPTDEIKEAEVALGLDKNIFYILRKMGK